MPKWCIQCVCDTAWGTALGVIIKIPCAFILQFYSDNAYRNGHMKVQVILTQTPIHSSSQRNTLNFVLWTKLIENKKSAQSFLYCVYFNHFNCVCMCVCRVFVFRVYLWVGVCDFLLIALSKSHLWSKKKKNNKNWYTITNSISVSLILIIWHLCVLCSSFNS